MSPLMTVAFGLNLDSSIGSGTQGYHRKDAALSTQRSDIGETENCGTQGQREWNSTNTHCGSL